MATQDGADTGESLKFFDESRIPVRSILLDHPDTAGKSPDQYEIIGEKITYRLIQNPGSYEVLKVSSPRGQDQRDRADRLRPGPGQASLMTAAPMSASSPACWWISSPGTCRSIASTSAWRPPASASADRGSPRSARKASACWPRSTPPSTPRSCKAGSRPWTRPRSKPVAQATARCIPGYFWPVYGELDEVCFPFHTSRSHDYVSTALGLTQAPGSVLLTDGYAAYQRYAEKTGLTHAQCWAHCRRHFENALESEPAGVEQALIQIQALYAVEQNIRDQNLTGDAKQLYRLTHSKPKLEVFFDWVERQFERQGFTPTHPFIQALAYAKTRRLGLEVFVTDPDVPIDTNHLERALRVIPMGRNYPRFVIMEGRAGGIPQNRYFSALVSGHLH